MSKLSEAMAKLARLTQEKDRLVVGHEKIQAELVKVSNRTADLLHEVEHKGFDPENVKAISDIGKLKAQIADLNKVLDKANREAGFAEMETNKHILVIKNLAQAKIAKYQGVLARMNQLFS